MWDSRAYKHSVKPIPLFLLATVVLGSIAFSGIDESTLNNAKRLAGYETMQTSWEQKMNTWCTDQTNSFLNRVKKTGRGYESYKEFSDNCRLLYYQTNPIAQSENPELFSELTAELAAKDARQEERRKRCLDDVDRGFNAAVKGEARPFNSGDFGRGYDVGLMLSLVKKPELEKRLENASTACWRAK